jgi:hypothetical protein
VCATTMSSHNKLKKRTYPPPSYRPPPIPAAELSFIAHSPPSPEAEYSNFPYSFYNNYVSMNETDRRRSQSRTRSSVSLISSPTHTNTTRPGTVLSMNSATPLLNPGGNGYTHYRSGTMPARKLTKVRRPGAPQAIGFETLPYAELLSPSLPQPPQPPPQPPPLLPQMMVDHEEQSPPRRRSTINWKVTWSLRRRNTGKDKEREISRDVGEDGLNEKPDVLADVIPLGTLPVSLTAFYLFHRVAQFFLVIAPFR